MRALLGVILLLLPSFAFADFPDVHSSHPYINAIGYVQKEGIVKGFPDGTYRPEQPVNRAEFTKIFLGSFVDASALASCPLATVTFKDVPRDAWFAPSVCIAVGRSIIKGYSDGTFRPTQNVSAAEAAKFIVSAILGAMGKELVPSNPWYQAPLQALSALGAIPSTVKRVDSPLTRGEMAEIIYRLQQEKTHLSSQSYESLLP